MKVNHDNVSSKTDCARRHETVKKVTVNCDPGEEVVVSGVSGSFPQSDNVREFGENLINKKDLVTITSTQIYHGTYMSDKYA